MTGLEQKLLASVRAYPMLDFFDPSWQEAVNEVTSPSFDYPLRYRDWYTLVPPELRVIWDDLSVESKIVAYVLAAHFRSLTSR